MIIQQHNELTIHESERRNYLEQVIERNITGFMEAGIALIEIRDNKLYKNDYSTFEDYCSEKWKLSRNYAYRFIKASEVIKNLLPMGNIPINERQTRPLASLEPEQQKKLWMKAVETAPNGKVTAAHVEQIVDNAIMEHRSTGTIKSAKSLEHKLDIQKKLTNQQKLTKQLLREQELKDLANEINIKYTVQERKFFLHFIKT